MSISCDQTKPRMMELLYGELTGPDRVEIEAHFAGCASCQAEMAGFQRTRATVRGVLEQPAPARAREAILRAAAAQVAAAAKPVAVPSRTAETPAVPDRGSVWDWLRRRWALPTLATVGAVAVFVLASQMFLKPETMMGNRGVKSPVPSETALEGLAEQEPAAPAAQAAPEAPAPAIAAKAPSDKTTAKADAAERRSASEKPGRRAKAATAHRIGGNIGRLDELSSSKAVAKGGADWGGAGFGRFAEPPPPREPAKAKAEDVATTAPPVASKPAKKALADAPAAPVVAAAPPPAAPGPAQISAESTRSEGGSVARAKRKMAEADEAADEAEENSARRADQLFARARWAEAAAAYRTLLKNDPQNADAPRWRRRVSAAEENARREATPETP